MAYGQGPVLVSSNFCMGEERYFYNWIVPNFPKNFKERSRLDHENYEIETGRDTILHSKWIVGISATPDDFVKFTVKLNDNFGSPLDKLLCSATVELMQNNGSTEWFQSESTKEKDKSLEIILLSLRKSNRAKHVEKFLDSKYGLNIAFTLTFAKVRLDEDVVTLEKELHKKSVLLAADILSTVINGPLTFMDVKMICSDKKEIFAHKLVLKNWSSVFEKMFQNNLLEAKVGIVEITDLPSKGIEALVSFFYTGKLPDCWRNDDVIVAFVSAADKYNVTPLLTFFATALGKLKFGGYSGATLLNLRDAAQNMNFNINKKAINDEIQDLASKISSCDEIVAMFGTVKEFKKKSA